MGQGKKIIPLPENQKYSEIIFSIARGNNYLQKIAEDIKANPSNTLKKLRYLEKNNFLNSKIEGNKKVFPFEKKVYSINYDRFLKEFIPYFINSGIYPLVQTQDYPEIEARLKDSIKKIEEDLKNPDKNNSLKEYLELFIKLYSKKESNIKDKHYRVLIMPLFNLQSFIMDLSEKDKRDKILEKSKARNEEGRLKEILDIALKVERLKEDYAKEHKKAKDKWIKEDYGDLLNELDKNKKN